MPGPRWIVDTSHMPLVTIALPGHTASPPDIDAVLADVDAVLARRVRVVFLHDLRFANPDAARRQKTGEWLRRNADAVRRYIVAYALVTPTALHRGLIVAMRWLADPGVPFEGFSEQQSLFRPTRSRCANNVRTTKLKCSGECAAVRVQAGWQIFFATTQGRDRFCWTGARARSAR